MSWIKQESPSWYQKFLINIIKCGPVPRHIAFIMDGNRRYAKELNVETKVGHFKGFQKLSNSFYWCRLIGIKEITFYTFSLENFNRSKDEVDTLMTFGYKKIEELLDQIDDFHANGVCLRFIGNMAMISEGIRARVSEAMLLTKDNKECILNVAIAYTSQDEIAHAMETIRIGIRNKEILDDDIDEYLLSKCMYAKSEVDILIRTSGEVRFSDFMLWQSSNANVLFRKVLWPNFSFSHLVACVFCYQMHHGDQKKIQKVWKCDIKAQKNERVESFLEHLENKKLLEWNAFASNV